MVAGKFLSCPSRNQDARTRVAMSCDEVERQSKRSQYRKIGKVTNASPSQRLSTHSDPGKRNTSVVDGSSEVSSEVRCSVEVKPYGEEAEKGREVSSIKRS